MNVISINKKYKYKINISYPVTKYLDINKKIYNIINDIRNEFVKVSKRNIIMNVYFTLYIKYEEYSYDDIISYKKINLYDEVMLNPDLSKVEN